MALNVISKPQSSTSSTPSRVISRPEIPLGRKTASSARAEALKARLKAPTSQPVAPRPAGSTARAEGIASQKRFAAEAAPQAPKISDRSGGVNLSEIKPPPSGATSTPRQNVEAPKPSSTEATGQQVDPQSAALIRREQQVRKAQKDLQAAKDAWKQEQANYIPKSQLTSETLRTLSEAGITADRLVELQINQAGTADNTPKDPQQVLLDEISALKKQVSDLIDPENGTLAKRDKAEYDQAVQQIRQDATLVVESNPKFGTIKSEGTTEDVVELVTKVFDEEGIILDVEEAASLVEAKLVDRLTKQLDRVKKLDKFKSQFGTVPEVPEATPAQQSPATPHQATTLTNAGASQRPLSARDRAVLKVQAALERAKGR